MFCKMSEHAQVVPNKSAPPGNSSQHDFCRASALFLGTLRFKITKLFDHTTKAIASTLDMQNDLGLVSCS